MPVTFTLDEAKQVVRFVVDDTSNGCRLGENRFAIIREKGEQFKNSSVIVLVVDITGPVGIAVHSYLDVPINDDEAIALAKNYIAEISVLTEEQIQIVQVLQPDKVDPLQMAVDALKQVQIALAAHRDGEKYVHPDHPEHGEMTLEELKYCVVDPALDYINGSKNKVQ
jgi:methionine synthase II (cobalamin-independent)